MKSPEVAPYIIETFVSNRGEWQPKLWSKCDSALGSQNNTCKTRGIFEEESTDLKGGSVSFFGCFYVIGHAKVGFPFIFSGVDPKDCLPPSKISGLVPRLETNKHQFIYS